MNWLLFIAGILSGIVLTLVLQAWVLSWLFSPIDEDGRPVKPKRTNTSWWRG